MESLQNIRVYYSILVIQFDKKMLFVLTSVINGPLIRIWKGQPSRIFTKFETDFVYLIFIIRTFVLIGWIIWCHCSFWNQKIIILIKKQYVDIHFLWEVHGIWSPIPNSLTTNAWRILCFELFLVRKHTLLAIKTNEISCNLMTLA